MSNDRDYIPEHVPASICWSILKERVKQTPGYAERKTRLTQASLRKYVRRHIEKGWIRNQDIRRIREAFIAAGKEIPHTYR